LALALAWFVGAVAVPYFQVRAVAAELAERRNAVEVDPYGFERRRVWGYFHDGRDPLILRLGGPERAAAKLDFYRRLPDWLAPHRCEAVFLLGLCGDGVVPELTRALKDKNAGVRAAAASALGRIDAKAQDAVPALVAALSDSSEDVRAYAAQSLGQIGSDSPEVIAALERLSQGEESGIVHHLAVKALEQIREKHPPSAHQSK
jgi:hypothetical protein